MMTKAYAVIGANFGDEGKGRVVDYLCRTLKKPTIVVRFNGGAQSGHTVVSPTTGDRFVFGHICAGTLAGCDSFLSHRFIANPFLFGEEIKGLASKRIVPTVLMDQHTPITTLYDMLVNREIETIRGNKRHGSCGYGVSETVERLCSSSRYKIFFRDIGTPQFEHTVKRIKDEYLPKRLKELGIAKVSDWFAENIESTELLSQFLCLSHAMAKFIMRPTDPRIMKNHHKSGLSFLKDYRHIVFEGGQGLCLDERRAEFFPHLTRSKTGLTNVIEICRNIGIAEITVFYVTRAYLTRHGAGPMPNESKDLSYEDMTNVNNDWQGPLRLGYLDFDLLQKSLGFDQSTFRKDVRVNKRLAITCLDQVGDEVTVRYKGKLTTLATKELAPFAQRVLKIDQVATSESPSYKEYVPA